MTKEERLELAAVWRERIADLRSSGMPVWAWADAHQVTEYQVHYWRRKLRSTDEGPEPGRARFMPVTVKDLEKETAAALTVKVGSIALEVRADCDMDLLQRVVRTLTLA